MAFPNVHIVAKSLRMCFVGASWQWYTMRMHRTDVFSYDRVLQANVSGCNLFVCTLELMRAKSQQTRDRVYHWA